MLKVRVLVLSLILAFLFQSPVAEVPQAVASETQVETRTLDPRAQILQAYLEKRNSPLQYHSQDFIEAADEYNLDWKLVPAISGVESTFGKAIPGGHDPATISYNGWGWGVYGTQSLAFDSWRDGIFTVSKGLRTRYFDRGLTDPYSINKVYAASQTWGTKVSFFLNDISKFEQQYDINYQPETEAQLNIEPEFTAPSAQLTSQQS